MQGVENLDPNLPVDPSKPGLKRKRDDELVKSNSSGSTLMKPTTTTSSKSLTSKPLAPKAAAPLLGRTASGSIQQKPPLASRSVSKPTIAPPPAKRAKVETLSTAPAAPASKRPAWDTKGRLQDMEDFTAKLQEQMNSLSLQLVSKESEIQTVSTVKESLAVDVSQFHRETETMQQRISELNRIIDADSAKHRVEIDQYNGKVSSVQGRLDLAEIQLASSKSECERLRFNLSQTAEQLDTVSKELALTRENLRVSSDISDDRLKRLQDLERKIADQREQIKFLEEKARDDEEIRRKLHNSIQELKGNIRVFCRIRPLSKSEVEDKSVSYQFSKTDDTAMDIVCAPQTKDVTGCKNAPDKTFNFKFDKVFPPGSSQEAVFGEISQLVQSALDGYNTCIFAYGQTGSGKTYTMEGPEAHLATVDNRGMIARAVEQIFLTSYRLAEKGWEYQFQASFVEIYNETVRDLLASTKPGAAVTSPERIDDLLKRANKNRAVGSTKMNERSSRSHSVFQLRLTGKNKVTEQSIEGILNLIDLAGSERLNQSQATGDRLKETQAINKSLSCLGDVIAALANKDKHIPYRNSKLTYLLQDSLGGNSKTLMFVNVSPAASNLNETLNSLRFAQKVNACDIGTARSNAKIDLNS
eukprot:TRINITY_DN4555_c0_g1_i4.p1 TRINITY_DN4555_c0_g1~~TRINITY_DN4555_c0_g1_i4.p1  ORF type:complete len:642 (-),score=134.80 TRINITY_DN4555_c0_g1_i4:3797-5722(-)